jgi:very-short-patch-repair endonuclease
VFAVDPPYGGEKHKPPDHAIAELAAAQYGVVARRQLLALGLSRRAIERRLSAGRLLPLYRAVYAVGHSAIERRGHWMAAVLARGAGAVLSHRSAAALWGIRDTAQTRIDVTTGRRASRGQPGIRLHRATLTAEDQTTHDRIPTTSLPRTLLDLASCTPLDAVVRALEEAERRRLIDTGPIHPLLERTNGHQGAGLLAKALAAYDPRATRTKSELERAFLALCRTRHLPPPTLNTLVEGYEVDAVWPERKLIVELDGYAYHRTRAAFEQDRRRDAAVLLVGYRTLRVTALRLEAEPDAVLAEVGVLLKAA